MSHCLVLGLRPSFLCGANCAGGASSSGCRSRHFPHLEMARTIPFFAVVAGPITALNLQDFAVKQFGLEPSVQGRLKNWSIAGRLASLCIGVILLGLAWPGYLHPSPDDPRRTRHVGWDVEADPTLAETANALHQLHEQGVLRDDSHGFNFNPDIANVCAWFCPEEKAFFDYRLQLYPDILTAYTQTKSGTPSKDDVTSLRIRRSGSKCSVIPSTRSIMLSSIIRVEEWPCP